MTLEGFRTYSIGAGYQPFADALDAMWRIYNESIKEFENKDDDYAKQIDQHYDEWGAGWAKRQDFWRGAGDIVRGAGDAYNSLRLDYPNTAFDIASDDSLGVIRFITRETSNVEIPFSSELGGTATGKPPFTGNGFTGATNGQIIPEYQCNSFLTVKEGAELWEIGRDGTETLLAVYSELQGRFVKVK